MNKNSGMNHLTQINSLTKLFNDVIKMGDINTAYNLIYKMRILHGTLLIESNKPSETTDEKLFDLSCLHSILSIINTKIIESETLFNKLIVDNSIDLSTLQISKPDNDLPLFSGAKSGPSMINSIFKTNSSEFEEKLPSLLLFFNPNCGACIKTKPFWDEVIGDIKQMFAKDIPLFNIMEVNLSNPNNQKLSKLFKVEYIPTIIMMEPAEKPNARIEKKEGSSTKAEIEAFIKNSFDKFINL
jgi:thiol-disulfide isomerase/thioredoxin